MKQAKRRLSPSKTPLNFMFKFDDKWDKISLVDGQSIYFHDFHYTDEGWASSDTRLTRKGNTIIAYNYYDERDCDGRLSSESVHSCHKGDLRAIPPYRHRGEKKSRIRIPLWNTVDRGQRDYAAEAMGY